MLIAKEQIEQTLHILVGLPLSDMWRFAGWQRFEFGPQRPFVNKKGMDAAKADYAIHVACDWRIVGSEGIVVGSADYLSDSERHDQQAEPFFKMLVESPPIALSVKADSVGSIHLTMTGGYVLDIMPMGAIQEEQWIFLPPNKPSFTLDKRGFGT